MLKAANNGNPRGYGYVGVGYLNGYGTNQNIQEAIVWLKKAADEGDAEDRIGWQIFW